MKSVLSLSLLLGAFAAPAEVPADVTVRALPDGSTAFRRAVIGVNHLAYGKDGYGMLLPGKHATDPDLVEMQKAIGFGSLRYPGGCGGTHPFDWKKNAGLSGNYWMMGVVEFMDMCEEVGADPILGISSHRGTPEEAAEYVEFLNAPADDAHPWAKKRAARGRAKPYAVRYFEYGNETYHGTHPRKGEPKRRITPEEYADSYVKFAAAMKAADPRIFLGAVLGEEGSGWNQRVLARLRGTADFFIRHTYCGMPERTTEADYLTLFLNRRKGLEKMLAGQIAEIGRPDAKLAITEFNTTIAHYRTLSAGLVNLETLMALAASPNVVHADYWQFVNEGFGMVRGTRGNYVKRPNAWAFELFSRYTLDTLLPVAVDDRQVATRPKRELDPEIASVLGRNFAEKVKFGYPGSKGTVHKGTGTEYVYHDDGEHELRFLEERAMNFYHLQAYVGKLPKGDRCNWKVSCKMRVEGMKGEDLNLDVTDGRGWSATHSSAALPAVGSPDWIEVSTVYSPLIDNPGSLILRFRRDGAAATGTAFVRDLRVEAVAKEEPRESAVTGQLSVAADGKAAALVLMNRSFSPREVAFDLCGIRGFDGKGAAVTAEALSGPSAYATNEEIPDNVKLVPFAATVRGETLRTTLPPHSAVGFRFTPAASAYEDYRGHKLDRKMLDLLRKYAGAEK